MKQYDVAAMGELLIDLTQNGYSDQGNPIFEANPGGAPCNVLAMLHKLGRNTVFLGKVGRDGFGCQLEEALKENGIATCILILQYTQPWRLYRKRMRVTGISGFTENQELISCFVKRRSGKN